MNKAPITILFFADSHLGFDDPVHPRIERRRRGDDFFANYCFLLDTALKQNVDLVIHGGDFFFRSRVPPSIIEKAYQPLVETANAGLPIYLVPGNHERSHLPDHLWLHHPNIHVFDHPSTFQQEVRGTVLSLSGFPFARSVRSQFRSLVEQTGWQAVQADIRLLCMHQSVEGARVGPVDFTFRADPDTIAGAHIPVGFAAVLSGHIHRSQVLTHTLDGQAMEAAVIYPGSIERTSLAERFEEKHYVILKFDPEAGITKPEVEFLPLKTRPMVKVEIPARGKGVTAWRKDLQDCLNRFERDAVVSIHFTGEHADQARLAFSAAELRGMAAPGMNVSLAFPRGRS